MSYYPQNKEQPPPEYAPGYQSGYQGQNQQPSAPPVQANAPQIINQTFVQVQPTQQQPQPFQQPIAIQPRTYVHRFYGCCDAKIGWSIIYGIVLFCKIISLIISADEYFESGSVNVGPLIETIILTICVIALFIAMFGNKSVFFFPIIVYNGLTMMLFALQFIGCMLYVFGAQTFSINLLEGLSYLNKTPFIPEPWDTDDDIDFDGDHVVGAVNWLGMLFFGIWALVASVVYGILTKGLNDYRKWMMREL